MRDRESWERRFDSIGRGRTEFDLSLGSVQFRFLSKRRVVFEIVKRLMQLGANPVTIEEAVASPGNGVWFMLPGSHDRSSFIETVLRNRVQSGRAFSLERWFVGDDELFQFGEYTLALSNQWGESTFQPTVVGLIQQFPDARIDIQLSP
jgi:hypothetical protein